MHIGPGVWYLELLMLISGGSVALLGSFCWRYKVNKAVRDQLYIMQVPAGSPSRGGDVTVYIR